MVYTHTDTHTHTHTGTRSQNRGIARFFVGFSANGAGVSTENHKTRELA